VWVLPTLTSAVNGTTDTQRLGTVSCGPVPNRMLTRVLADVTTDWIGAPAMEPVLSSTIATSRPVDWLMAVAPAVTTMLVNPSSAIRVIGTAALPVILVVEAAGCVTSGVVATALRYPDPSGPPIGWKFALNSAMPSAVLLVCDVVRAAASTPASTATCRRDCTSQTRAESIAIPGRAISGTAASAVMIATLPRRRAFEITAPTMPT